MNFPFPVDAAMTAITVGYRNSRLIADRVLPRVPVGGVKFEYLKFDLAEGFTVPDSMVGRRSRPSEVTFTAEKVADATRDWGLEDPIPSVDINNAPPNFNPTDYSVMMLTNLILLGREKRVADLVFNPASYPSGKKVQLSAGQQWSHADSTPIADIVAAMDAQIFRPNIMVIGRVAFRVLCQHPHIIKAVNKSEAELGIAQRSAIAALFELDDVLVGESWINSAKKGQAVNLETVWGKHCALLYLDPDARSTEGMPTFGFTAQYLTRVAGAAEDRDIGLRGGVRVRVGESVRELVSAPDMGYFIEDAVA